MTEDNKSEIEIAYLNTIAAAFNYLAVGLEPYVKEQLQRRYKDAWQINVSSTIGRQSLLTDPYALLNTIYYRWNDAFSDSGPKNSLNCSRKVVDELRVGRNKAGHGEPFSAESFEKSISSMLTLLESVPPSEKIDKTVEKIKWLRQHPLHLNVDQPLPAGNKSTEAQIIEEDQITFAPQDALALSEPGIELNQDQQDKNAVTEQELKSEQTAPVGEAPAVTYKYNRLCFMAKHIEPLNADEAFRVVTPVGAFQMTKAEFYRAFPKVVITKSYTESGIYHYPVVPRSALPYKMSE